MDHLLNALRAKDALRGDDQIYLKSVPKIAPKYDNDNIIRKLRPDIQNALKKLGIERLYEHQAQAIDAALQGKDVILVAPTASGKTYAFLLPLLNMLLSDSKSHGLMLHPMKALSNDQRRQLEELVKLLESPRKIESWVYDGDTDGEYRKLLRSEPPAILFTNPEMLHASFLGWSSQWEKFLRNLKFIIIDEIHEYRGYFGTHFALLMRRFLNKLHALGANPQLFLISATCANPEEHAFNLTGRSGMQLIQSNSEMRPERHYIFVNPAIPSFKFSDIFLLRIANASLACLSEGLSTLVFCPTRRFAEDVAKKAKREAEKMNLPSDTIVPYRSGYTAEQRREIEDGLRTGKNKIVFSTNALELGIDIGKLDVCLLAGFPDNVMSAWQRIGRVGRRMDIPAYVLFYAMNNAIDQFYVNNIDAFLNKPLDQLAIGINNVELIDNHIPYLLHECGWDLKTNSVYILGQMFTDKAREKMKGARSSNPSRGPNYQKLGLRGDSDMIYKLMYKDKEIGTISRAQQFREAYLGAIYNHMGMSYRVESIGENEINLVGADPNHKTTPFFYTVVNEAEIFSAWRYMEDLSIYYGKLNIYENLAKYTLEDEKGEILDEVSRNEGKSRNAHAFWLEIEGTSIPLSTLQAGIGAVEQFIRLGTMFLIPCDRYDTNTFRDKMNVYIYETFRGGIGIASKVFDVWGEVIREGMKIAENCSCEDGCPRCIILSRLTDMDGMSKSAGFEIASHLLQYADLKPTEKFDPSIYGWVSAT